MKNHLIMMVLKKKKLILNLINKGMQNTLCDVFQYCCVDVYDQVECIELPDNRNIKEYLTDVSLSVKITGVSSCDAASSSGVVKQAELEGNGINGYRAVVFILENGCRLYLIYHHCEYIMGDFTVYYSKPHKYFKVSYKDAMISEFNMVEY